MPFSFAAAANPHYAGFRSTVTNPIALSAILGAPVYDDSGQLAGHVREVALSPQEDPSRVSDLVVKTPEEDRLLSAKAVFALEGRAARARGTAGEWLPR